MQNASALPHCNALRPALLWAAVCLILLGVLLSLLPGARLNSSVLAMLPKQTLGAIPPALNDGFMQRLDRQLILLVSPGKQPDPRVAQQWLTLLQRSRAECRKGPLDAAGQQAREISSGSTAMVWSIRPPAPACKTAVKHRPSGSCPSSTPPFPA